MIKKKPIKPSNNLGRENEIDFDTLQEHPTERLLNLILTHQKKSGCTDCKWNFAIVGYDKVSMIKNFDKPCLLIIHTELIPVKSIFMILNEKFGFLENTIFKPELIDFLGAVLIYRE
jgi:hypothetical protein